MPGVYVRTIIQIASEFGTILDHPTSWLRYGPKQTRVSYGEPNLILNKPLNLVHLFVLLHRNTLASRLLFLVIHGTNGVLEVALLTNFLDSLSRLG